jgi:hypothetical protein
MLGATIFDKEFVQQYTKLAAELLVESDISGDSGDDGTHSDSQESESAMSERSSSGWESQGTVGRACNLWNLLKRTQQTINIRANIIDMLGRVCNK